MTSFLAGAGLGGGVMFAAGIVIGWAFGRAAIADAAKLLLDSPIPYEVQEVNEEDEAGEEWKRGAGPR